MSLEDLTKFRRLAVRWVGYQNLFTGYMFATVVALWMGLSLLPLLLWVWLVGGLAAVVAKIAFR